METVRIEKYNPEDHKEVIRIFSQGIQEHWKDGIILGLQHPKIQGMLAVAFCYGFWFSWFCAFSYLILMLALQAFSVCLNYYGFVWERLRSDMKDKELEFWTTEPNRFLVAKTADGKVVGCVSNSQINLETAEMNRLSVDTEFRGLKIGQKLVEESMRVAKEDGNTVMYVTTSNTQVGAYKLYEKLGFTFLRRKGFGKFRVGEFLIDNFSGLYVCAYIKRL